MRREEKRKMSGKGVRSKEEGCKKEGRKGGMGREEGRRGEQRGDRGKGQETKQQKEEGKWKTGQRILKRWQGRR